MTTNNHDKDNHNSKSQELTPEELSQMVGGESPKETVTFEYGGLAVQYHRQLPDGKLSD
jgi:hypothetical protein